MTDLFEKISIMVDGRQYTGRYTVKGRLINIQADGLGIKSDFLNAYTKPHVIAEMLLRQLVREKARNSL